MTEEIHRKVVNIFERHRRGEHFHFEVEDGGELIISPDGFHYVSFKSEYPQGHQQIDELTDLADKKHYIIKILESHRDGGSRLNNYYVPGERLDEFLSSLSNRPGKILEIERVFPEQTA